MEISPQITHKAYNQLKKIGFNTHNGYLYIKDAGLNPLKKHKNIGVFTKKKIEESEIIEFCPAIALEWGQTYHHDPKIKQYCFWKMQKDEDPKHGQRGFLPLGYGALINCADSLELANVGSIISQTDNFVIIFAKKTIEPDQELLTWFGQPYYDFWCQ
jgi:hypothetical protein